MKEREEEFKASFQAMLQHTDPEIRQVVTSATKEHVDEESKVIKSVGEARPRRPRLTND
jgi:succinate dehydrogenase flavin-adding protein (antitoxin of CptAB toxin-antitoxin module)